MPKEKKLETEVVLCTGKADIFKEVILTFPGPTLPFFVEDVDVKLQNVDLQVVNEKCCNSVIFSGQLFINVIYKISSGSATAGTDGSYTVSGAVNHITQVVPVSGCIPIDCECISKCDKNIRAKLLDVCVMENHKLVGINNPEIPFPTYSRLSEQVCIKIKVKVVTDEIITINLEDEDDKKCEC